jgi:hypothetical protein
MVPDRECRTPTLRVSPAPTNVGLPEEAEVAVGLTAEEVEVGSSPPQAPRTITSASMNPDRAQWGTRRILGFEGILALLYDDMSMSDYDSSRTFLAPLFYFSSALMTVSTR